MCDTIIVLGDVTEGGLPFLGEIAIENLMKYKILKLFPQKNMRMEQKLAVLILLFLRLRRLLESYSASPSGCLEQKWVLMNME